MSVPASAVGNTVLVEKEKGKNKEVKLIKNDERPEQSDSPKEDQMLDQSVGASKKRRMVRNVGEGEVHNISNDEQRSKNIVDVFRVFLDSTPEVRSLWDSRFEFGNLIDVECSLPSDQNKNVADKEAENADSVVGVVQTELVDEVLGNAPCN
ncbi:ParA family protein [Sesbania bispinosa]|nr:ParA family protein [Sesbania bispinosa]